MNIDVIYIDESTKIPQKKSRRHITPNLIIPIPVTKNETGTPKKFKRKPKRLLKDLI